MGETVLGSAPSRWPRRRTVSARSSSTSRVRDLLVRLDAGARCSTAPPSEQLLQPALGKLDEAPVRVAQVRGAAPLVFARLQEELVTVCPESVAGRVEVGNGNGEVIFVRRDRHPSRLRARGRGTPPRRRRRTVRRPATPRLGPIRPANGRRSDRCHIVGEQRNLSEISHVAISNSRRTSFSDVLRSVERISRSHDQRAGQVEGACRVLFGRVPGNTNRARRHIATVLDRLLSRHVDDGDGRREDDVRGSHHPRRSRLPPRRPPVIRRTHRPRR